MKSTLQSTICALLCVFLLTVSIPVNAEVTPDNGITLGKDTPSEYTFYWENYYAGMYTEEQLILFVDYCLATADPDGKPVVSLNYGASMDEVMEIVTSIVNGRAALERSGLLIYIDAKENDIREIFLDLTIAVPENGGYTVYIYNPEEHIPTWDAGFPRGDVNLDYKVNAQDYMILKRYILGTFENLQVPTTKLDFSCDTKVDAKDYLILKRYILGTLAELPPESAWD